MHWYLLLAALMALAGIAALIITVLAVEAEGDDEAATAEPSNTRLRAS